VTPPDAAEIATPVAVVTDVVVTVNVPVVDPAATLTVAGTAATEEFALESVTPAPPVGAAPLSVTVPCDDAPPMTLAGASAIELTVTATAGGGGGVTMAVGVTVSVARFVTPASVVEMTTLVTVVTVRVVTVKLTEVAPGETNLADGTTATAVLLLVIDTRANVDWVPEIASRARDGLPPTTVAGVSVRPAATATVGLVPDFGTVAS
jgi:hypothetical protein